MTKRERRRINQCVARKCKRLASFRVMGRWLCTEHATAEVQA